MKTIEDNIKDRLQETFGINESHPSLNIWIIQLQNIVLTKIQSLQSEVSIFELVLWMYSVQWIKVSNLPFTLYQHHHQF